MYILFTCWLSADFHVYILQASIKVYAHLCLSILVEMPFTIYYNPLLDLLEHSEDYADVLYKQQAEHPLWPTIAHTTRPSTYWLGLLLPLESMF